jgi:hypothetical protein
VVVAAASSAAAGLVHAAAAGSHPGADELPLLFALCAVAQVGFAIAVVLRPGRLSLLAGVLVNGVAVLTWALSRTTGIAFLDVLAEPEAVGTQDLVAAVLGGTALVSALVALVRPAAPGDVPSASWVALVGVVALLVATPAMAAEHSHGGADHEHGTELAADHDHASGSGSGDAHEHGEGGSAHDGSEGHREDDHADGAGDGHHGDGGEGSHRDAGASHTGGGHAHAGAAPSAAGVTAPHAHGDAAGHDPALGDAGHAHPTAPTGTPGAHPSGPAAPPHDHPPAPAPTGPVVSLDDPRLTPAQRAAAQSLIDTTRAGMARFGSVAAVQAAGYASIGDGRGVGGYEHWVHWGHLADGRELDPNRIESIVTQLRADGSKRVVSAMYILNLGKTMAQVPDIAGSLTTWHDHRNLCWVGTRLAGLAVNGVCRPPSVLRVTPPMLHVWVVPHPCGPFAGIESHGGGACGHDH